MLQAENVEHEKRFSTLLRCTKQLLQKGRFASSDETGSDVQTSSGPDRRGARGFLVQTGKLFPDAPWLQRSATQ